MAFKAWDVSPDEMQMIIDEYLRSLIAYIPLTIDGAAALDEHGDPVTKMIWKDSPCVVGLCNWLNISKNTFSRWCRDEGERYHEQAVWAKQRIEEYLVSHIPTARQAEGYKFVLMNDFKESWKDKQELELGPETRASEALTAISLRDKLTLIIEASEKARNTMRSLPEDDAESDDKD
jgi:hypothetical protein